MSQEQKMEANVNNPEIPVTATTEYVTESEDNVQCIQPKENDFTQVNKARVPISDCTANEEKKEALKEAVRANKYTRAGIIVNILLIVITLAAFWQTKRSVDISAETLAQSKANDSISNIRNKEASELNERQFNETRKQFELITNPMLQVEIDENYLNTLNGWPTQIKYRIKNLGKYPVEITRYKIRLVNDDYPAKLNRIKNRARENFIGTERDSINILINDYTSSSIIRTSLSWLEDKKHLLGLLTKGKQAFYLYGQYYYTNLVNDENKKYEFIILINRDEIKYLHNKNTVVKDVSIEVYF